MSEMKDPDIRLDLPFPRLELVYQPISEHPRGYKARWVHRLVLQHFEGFVYAVTLSETFTDSQSPLEPDGSIRLPFRSGAQIPWDADHLKVPAYGIVGEKFYPISVDAERIHRIRGINRTPRLPEEE